MFLKDSLLSPAQTLRAWYFVEIKNSTLAAGVKVNHLSYIGDANLGAGVNVGAGTITVTYDGVRKHRTVIGAGSKTGANSVLVAPITLGEGVTVGAGSTLTRNVPSGAWPSVGAVSWCATTGRGPADQGSTSAMQAHHGPVQPEALVLKKATERFTWTEPCRLFHFAGHVSLIAEPCSSRQVGLVACTA